MKSKSAYEKVYVSFQGRNNKKRPVFDGRAFALDETAEVKEEDVRNKSTKLM
jgi:ribosomal protein L20A (L18A)